MNNSAVNPAANHTQPEWGAPGHNHPHLDPPPSSGGRTNEPALELQRHPSVKRPIAKAWCSLWLALAALLAAAGSAGPGAGGAEDDLTKSAGWRVPAAHVIRDRLFTWLDQQDVDESARAAAEAVWAVDQDQPTTGPRLLGQLVRTCAIVSPEARRLNQLCAGPRTELVPPSAAWLTAPETPPVVANNLRLLYGRWLAQNELYDEARDQLDGLEPGDVVDPASLLFYQSVVYHRLLDQQAGLQAIQQLLDGARDSPRRYEQVARLMVADLEDLKEDTLDHIARRMEDIGRRLDLGRAGPRLRQIEDGVIESLDKLIEELEQQRQDQQSGSSGQNLQSNAPAQDSQILSGKGPGRVLSRGIGSESGWGNLPPKQREQALQQIGREFPGHYREVIEQYFRKLASEENP